MIKEELIEQRKMRCLKYIKVFIETKDNSTSRLRGFIDDWYGFHKAGPYLNKKHNVRWLNNPDCTKPIIKDCLEGMDFISVGARAVLDGFSREPLIKEHAVPVKVIKELLLELPSNASLQDIERHLLKYYKLGALTKNEDKEINSTQVNSISLKSSMPEDWNREDMFHKVCKSEYKTKLT